LPNLIIVDDVADWSADLPDAEVVQADDYLTQPEDFPKRNVRIFNLCRSYRYQSSGYYVSLLARARGHKPLPGAATIQDLKIRSIEHLVTEELNQLIQSSLKPLQSDNFTLSIYFGRNLAKRYQRLATAIFNLLPAPLLRAELRRKQGEWQLRKLNPVALGEAPERHLAFIKEAASLYFSRPGKEARKSRRGPYDLAILVNEKEEFPPSDPGAIRRFVQAGRSVGFNVELISRNDSGRIAEFDALFIRETTQVNHHTYRCASRAAREGLIVIDDPDSIIRCSNKVFLEECLARKRIPRPKTLVVHRRNADTIADEVGLPCVLKEPDSSFSQGVIRVSTAEELANEVKRMLARSDLIIAQQFLPTDYDWRVGILAGQPLFACRYYMVKRHWQIYKRDARGKVSSGNFDTLPLADVPSSVIRLAERAARTMGNGFYGVDIKQYGQRLGVIEVNDNPNIDHGVEDKVLGKALYQKIMQTLFDRVQQHKQGTHG
jgi:glutathione synthase/RimK-type ligase-like ATP-grasp enzyme